MCLLSPSRLFLIVTIETYLELNSCNWRESDELEKKTVAAFLPVIMKPLKLEFEFPQLDKQTYNVSELD